MTVNLNHVANQVTTTGSAANVDLDLNPKGTGAIKFTSASTNYVKVTGGTTGFAPTFAVAGSDTNIGLVLQTKNTGAVTVQNDGGYPAVVLSTSTSGRTVTVGPYGIAASGFNTDIPYDISSKGKEVVSLSTQYGTHLKVGRTDNITNSIVNYAQIYGGPTGYPATLTAQGSDVNVAFSYYSKGGGNHNFYGSSTLQFAVFPVASAVNYLMVSGASGFNAPTLTVASSSWSDIDLGLVPLGTGMVKTSGTGLKLSGSSSGYVGLKGAAAAGSTTYTLPAADGTSGQVLSTNGSATLSWANPGSNSGPAFSAYSNNTAQAVTSSTWTKVALNVEVFDTNNNFDPTTNYRFTPTVAGYYQINGSLYLNYTGSAGARVGVSIYKNGSSYAENQLTNAAASLYGTMTVGSLIYFNGTTDYVELYGWYNSATSQFYGISMYTWLNGTLVRAA